MTTSTETPPETGPATAAHGESGRPSYDDVNTPVIVMVGVISMILTFLTIWFVEGVFYRWQSGLVRERNYDVVNPIQAEVIDGQRAVLDGDAERGIVSVQEAIDAVVTRYQNDSESGTENAPETGTGDEGESGGQPPAEHE